MGNVFKMTLRGAVSGVALAAVSTAAMAGGFAIREQSSVFQGSSFAGNAAGGALSSSFWNPAALATAKEGLSTESVFSLLMTTNEVTVSSATFSPLGSPVTIAGARDIDTGGAALVPASYGAYRLSPNLVIGVSMTAPFGLGSEPDNNSWAGATVGRTSKLTTYNGTINAAYTVTPGVTVGAGVQLEYAKLIFKFANSSALPVIGANNPSAPNAGLSVEDKIGVGFTAGILLQPSSGTTIGLGFRSSIKHDFEGNVFDNGNANNWVGVKAELETPETVTLSLRQKLAPAWTLLGTVEWSNWSKFDNVPIVRTNAGSGSSTFVGTAPNTGPGSNFAVLDANWHDGWFYSVGFEHDYSKDLQLRGGIAYEKSPIQNATERLVQVPDSDRIWLSGGLSYKLFASTTLDLAYTHIFVEDAAIDRRALTSSAIRLQADREASVDIVTLGLRTQWGAVRQLEPAPLK